MCSTATLTSCAAGDWLQGPYVYALYQHYNFSRGDIGRLFIAGFGSSMVFGTVVGALADRTCALHRLHGPGPGFNHVPTTLPELVKCCVLCTIHELHRPACRC